MLKIGCHLSTEGGYLSMGERIASVNGDTFQYFTKNPKGGNRNFKKPAFYVGNGKFYYLRRRPDR